MELHFVKRKLVTIITEAVIEEKIVRDVLAAGAKGYTVCEVWGGGSRGVRGGDWDAVRTIRVETVCGEEAAQVLVENLYRKYYRDYAMVVFQTDVEVTRPEKF